MWISMSRRVVPRGTFSLERSNIWIGMGRASKPSSSRGLNVKLFKRARLQGAFREISWKSHWAWYIRCCFCLSAAREPEEAWNNICIKTLHRKRQSVWKDNRESAPRATASAESKTHWIMMICFREVVERGVGKLQGCYAVQSGAVSPAR